MQLLAPHIDRSFHKNRRQHVFAGELIVKIQQLRGCFLGGALPLPSTKVIAAWNDLPNVTADNLSVSMKTGLVFLQAPPPTPTGIEFDTDGPTSSNPSSNSGHDDDDSWLLVDDATSSTSDVVAMQALEGSAASEDDSMSRYSYPDQSLDGQVNEEDSFRSPNSNSSSSDQESLSSSGEGSPVPVGFDNMVNQWLLDYRARGTDAFIESLIAFGVISVGTALQASRIARDMVRRLIKVSYTEGKNLESTIRSSALAAFKRCWESNDTSMEPSTQAYSTTPPTPYGINIASLIGGLFDQKISTVKDVHLCLSLLLEGDKRFDRLCAMHALLVQANDKLCKKRNLPALMQFRDSITPIGRESGEYLWVTGAHSRRILNDILVLIERWTISQTIKCEESRMYSGTGRRTIRNRAVGPRLRNGPGPGMVFC